MRNVDKNTQQGPRFDSGPWNDGRPVWPRTLAAALPHWWKWKTRRVQVAVPARAIAGPTPACGTLLCSHSSTGQSCCLRSSRLWVRILLGAQAVLTILTYVKIRVGDLRRIIREAIEGIESALADLRNRIKVGPFPLEAAVMVGGKMYAIRIVQDVDGRYGKQGDYFGLVDGGNFGGGKTPATALNKVKKRLEFLMSSSNVSPRKVDAGEQEARMADAELKRREKRGF